jgi:DNA-binding NarL/FixJ family response regulator
LPDLGGIQCLRSINQAAPQARLIVACGRLDEKSALLWLVAGAAGCLAKSAPVAELERACLSVFSLGTYLPAALLGEVSGSILRLRLISQLGGDLTSRETEVLIGLLLGQSNKDIAAWLGLDVGTVKTHIHRLLLRFSAATRSQLLDKCASAVAMQ